MAHYINPAFCQKSEFSQLKVPATSIDINDVKIQQNQFIQTSSRGKWTAQQTIQHRESKYRTEQNQKKTIYSDIIPNYEMDSIKYQKNTGMRFNSNGYALVPLEELSSNNKDRYCILRNGSLRLTKSHDNLDLIPPELVQEEEDSFTSLPAFTPQENSRKLMSAFSSDFINKSVILVDQNSMQRYTIVPTDDDEDVVDSNHEIIEMHNGRVHRYAVIPTDDDMETSVCIIEPEVTSGTIKADLSMKMGGTDGSAWCGPFKLKNETHSLQPEHKPKLTNGKFDDKHSIQSRMNSQSYKKSHQQTINYDESNYIPGTPTKNPIATQKLHKLLSTPRKAGQEILQRQGSYQTIIQRSPDQFQLQNPYATQEQSGFTPQKLVYEDKKTLDQNIDHRTTAIISPRLNQQVIYNNTTLGGVEKPWTHESFQKVESATATIGAISLMLILTGILNSGLCLYMITDMRRSYYLDLGVISGFAAASLGFMGFRSRQCYWLPNRNFISGYVLVTVFSLLNCCGLLVLLGLNPFPGTPFHDLTTGVILALSSLILLIISLGAITSKLCSGVPSDNRVDVF
ncbi:uncharacterized protein LOC129572326 [Sitodiplosis mosellana]|uniref:uncharacterized protein LOC129572326 n=1 Tax=Sitodiplosis mosellana TaxID=263140 RepID=UPI002444720B|nr:uncharacterized protein LOC129572326 [Sitodiplosis mosellana]